jgi:hypothetical protein
MRMDSLAASPTTNLQIPDESTRRLRAIDPVWTEDVDARLVAETIALPIVTAELRRLASEDQQKADRWKARERETVPGSQAAVHAAAFITRHEVSAARLCARANELDGGAA